MYIVNTIMHEFTQIAFASFVETVCANEPLPGTDSVSDELDDRSAGAAMLTSQSWCTPFNVPNMINPGSPGVEYSRQHFARMWYDLLISSPSFLDVKQGQDDPYSWTTGQFPSVTVIDSIRTHLASL